jgi:hypothetical protein
MDRGQNRGHANKPLSSLASTLFLFICPQFYRKEVWKVFRKFLTQGSSPPLKSRARGQIVKLPKCSAGYSTLPLGFTPVLHRGHRGHPYLPVRRLFVIQWVTRAAPATRTQVQTVELSWESERLSDLARRISDC